MEQEEDMSWNSPLIKNLLFYFMILVVIGLSIWLIVQVQNGGVSCMANPFSYQLKSIGSSDENKNPITCSCQCSFLPVGKFYYITKNNTIIMDSFTNLNNQVLNSSNITYATITI